MTDASTVIARSDRAAVQALLEIEVARYVLTDTVLTAEMILKVHHVLGGPDGARVGSLPELSGLSRPQAFRAVMWLAKLNLVEILA